MRSLRYRTIISVVLIATIAFLFWQLEMFAQNMLGLQKLSLISLGVLATLILIPHISNGLHPPAKIAAVATAVIFNIASVGVFFLYGKAFLITAVVSLAVCSIILLSLLLFYSNRK